MRSYPRYTTNFSTAVPQSLDQVADTIIKQLPFIPQEHSQLQGRSDGNPIYLVATSDFGGDSGSIYFAVKPQKDKYNEIEGTARDFVVESGPIAPGEIERVILALIQQRQFLPPASQPNSPH